MSFLLMLGFPFLVVISPLVLQIIYSRKAIENMDGEQVVFVVVGALLLGLFTPVLGTYISTLGYRCKFEQAGCLQGATIFIGLGYFIMLPMSFFFGVAHYVQARKRKNAFDECSEKVNLDNR